MRDLEFQIWIRTRHDMTAFGDDLARELKAILDKALFNEENRVTAIHVRNPVPETVLS